VLLLLRLFLMNPQQQNNKRPGLLLDRFPLKQELVNATKDDN